MSAGQAVTGLVAGAALAQAATWALHRYPPGGEHLWHRTNHAGSTVTLLEGPAFATAASVAGAVAGGGLPAIVAGVGAAGFGALDDLRGDSSSKGLRGHLAALRSGRLTTGAVKVVGLAATGLLAAALSDRRSRASGPGLPATLAGAALVAGAANLANLFDLRPGRALKATVLAAVAAGIPAGAGAGVAAAAVGAALGALPDDLAGRSMLGDTGANAAGAIVGLAIVERAGLRGRVSALALVTLLTLASERVSFTKVIEATPPLRALDRLGRPAPLPAQ